MRSVLCAHSFKSADHCQGKFASPFGVPPRRAQIREDHLRAWGEEGVVASECDKEVEHRQVFRTKHLNVAAIRHPPC